MPLNRGAFLRDALRKCRGSAGAFSTWSTHGVAYASCGAKFNRNEGQNLYRHGGRNRTNRSPGRRSALSAGRQTPARSGLHEDGEHIAVTFEEDGKNVTWLEHLSEDEYKNLVEKADAKDAK